MELIAELPQSAASGLIADIYDDIRATLRVPAVNLIWRHLATIDGALETIWSAVRPLYVSDRMPRDAEALFNFPPLTVNRWADEALELSDIDLSTRRIIQRVFENYAHSNPPNLIALMAVEAVVQDDYSSAPLTAAVNDLRTANHVSLPPLVNEESMSPTVRELGCRLTGIGTNITPEHVVAGVPRHLAHWPAFLSLCVDTLAEIEGEVAYAISQIERQARQYGRQFATLIGSPKLAHISDDAVQALHRFTAPEGIPNFIVKVRILQQALGT